MKEEYDAKLGFEPKIQKSKSELQDNALKMQNMDSRIATQMQNNESVKQLVNSILEAQDRTANACQRILSSHTCC